MPSADQVPVISAHSTMLWPKWVVLIAGSTGSALRAVRPPNRHITPVARCDLVQAARCQAVIMRSNSRICAFSSCSWAPRAVTHVDFGIADDGKRAGREQAAQIAIASLADTGPRLNQHRICRRALRLLPAGDRPESSLRQYPLSRRHRRRSGECAGGLHRHAGGPELW
jgi:hypothetical protein